MIEYVQTNWEQILTIIATVVASASAVAALTPNTTDNKVIGSIRKLLDLLAFNVKHAKNEKK